MAVAGFDPLSTKVQGLIFTKCMLYHLSHATCGILKKKNFLLQRMTIVGVILSFRELLREALNAQLEERIPFLYSTIEDFHEHASLPEQTALVRLGVNGI
jgi:hypothetical protein